MTCHYCRSVNVEGEHRCRRCGRRLAGKSVEAPPEHAARALQNVGANALAALAATAEFQLPEIPRPKAPRERSAQPTLFPDAATPNIIPFERAQRAARPAPAVTNAPGAEQDADATAELFPSRSAVKARPNTARRPPLESPQSTLDFLPPAPQAARMLKTTVEAAIHCDARPASPVHRASAAAIDTALVGASFACFYGLFQLFGGGVAWTRQTLPIFGALFGLIALFYGFIWMIANRESAGMRWADLRIVNFNGYSPDRKTRALRSMGCVLTACSGMIGFFWSLVDEEGLTWHDHMSNTFPTIRDTGSHLMRH